MPKLPIIYLSIGKPLVLWEAQQCILMSAATSSIRAMITLYVKKVVSVVGGDQKITFYQYKHRDIRPGQ